MSVIRIECMVSGTTLTDMDDVSSGFFTGEGPMSQKNRIQNLHWGQLTTLWVVILFAWVVIVGVALSLSPNGQASDKTEAYLFALLVLSVAIMLGVTFTWFGGRKTLSN